MKNVKNIETILLKRDGARCSICGKKLTDENMCIDQIFPRGLNRKDFCKLVNISYRTMTEWELDNRHAG